MKINTNLFKISDSAFLKLSTLLLVFAFAVSAVPQNVFAAVAKTSAAADNAQDENFDKKFREGRDLIDKQDWKKAAEKFNEVINQYPGNKSVDAALYWLAFCYKKQREFEKVGATVDRLVKDYPSSSWTSDARILLIEVAQPSTVIYGTAAQNMSISTGTGGSYAVASNYPASNALKPGQPLTITSVSNGSDAYAVMSGFYASETRTPLDREDEIKIAAFQSLLSADYTKAIQATSDIFKADSKNSEALKIEVLRVLRRPRITENVTPVERAFGNSSPSVRSQYVSDIKEPLLKLFRNESNAKIRTEMIYTLASLKDEQTTNYLSELYNSEGNVDVKKAIINGLGSSWGFGGFYTFSSNTVNAAVVNSPRTGFGQNLTVTTEKADADKKPEFVKLLEIVKTEKDSELRRLALTNVQRFSGWQRNAQMVDVLSRIYDSETDETFKKSLIQSLARFDQPQAAQKLLEIAKTDKSDKLKLEAIYALGKSKDPAAVNYLQQVLQ